MARNNEKIRFEGKTLDDVYEKASSMFNCSITHLEIDIFQAPSKGFLGLFAKNAIIDVRLKTTNTHTQEKPKHKKQKNYSETETLKSKLDSLVVEEEEVVSKVSSAPSQVKQEEIFDGFYDNKNNQKELHKAPIVKKDSSDLQKEISDKVNQLFSTLCYNINPIDVKIDEEKNTVNIEFSGDDSALLIGKEGYRYKALSYILFNWINEKYDMMLRLEVAEFLANQEASMDLYLEPVIDIIEVEGYYKTKILDGILVHIALTKLRERFPDKYVAVKTTQKGEKYILVNEYRN